VHTEAPHPVLAAGWSSDRTEVSVEFSAPDGEPELGEAFVLWDARKSDRSATTFGIGLFVLRMCLPFEQTDTGITPGATAGKGITAKLGKPATKRRKTTVRKHTRVIAPGAAGALVDEDEEVSIPSGIKFQNARTLAAKEACRITRDRSGQLTVRLNPNNEYSEWVKTVLEQVAAGL